MSQDLVDQLAAYGRQLRSSQPPIPRSEMASEPSAAIQADVVDINNSIQLDQAEEMMLAPDSPDRPRRRRAMLTVAAAVVGVLVVGLVAVAFRDTDDDLASSDNPPRTEEAAVTTAEAEVDPVSEAEAVGEDYFVVFNEGDAEAVFALFAPDANFVGNDGAATAEAFREMLHWDTAQGTQQSTPECSTTAADSDAPVKVTCRYDHFDALMQAADTDPVSYATTLTIEDGLIIDLDKRRVAGGFAGSATTQFDLWMGQNHPDDKATAGCCGWDSVEDATASGQLRARYAEEWATSLESS